MRNHCCKNSLLIFTLLLFGIFPYSAKGQEKSAVETVLQKGHAFYVSCLDYSPNGKFVATGSYDHNIILWNASNGKQIRTFSMHTAPVKTLYFSPDGTKIVSNAGNRVLVYDIVSGQVLVELYAEDYPITNARFSPDGKKIMTSDNHNQMVLWNAITGKKIASYAKDYSATVSSQWTTPEANKFLSFFSAEAMQLVDLSDSLNAPVFSIDRPFTYAISPSDDIVAVSSYKSSAKVFDLHTGKELNELMVAKENICNGCKLYMAFSYSGKYLVTATKYSDVIVWDVKKGTQIVSIEKPEFWIDDIAFSPDGKHVVISGDGESFVWNTKTGKQELHLMFGGLECISVFSPDSKFLLTNNENNTAALWNITTGQKQMVFEGYMNKDRTDGLDFDQADWFHSNIIKYLERKNKAILSPDGKFIAKGGIDSIAVLINVETGKVEREFIGHNKLVISCSFSQDGNSLLTGSGDNTMKLWDVKTGKLIRTFNGHQGLIFDAKFSPDGQYVASASWDGSIRIWDKLSGKQLKYIYTKNASPYCLDYTLNGLYLLSGDLNKELKLWEVDTAKEFRNIVGHTNIVSDICFSYEGQQFITASFDGKVKVWDLLSGMLVNKLTHPFAVYSATWNPINKTIVTGGSDRVIRIWNPATGQVLHSLYGHSGGVTSLQISSDAKRLVSCSVDGEIKIWDLDSFKELYTYLQIDRKNWLARNPQGYFDGSSSALKHINYVSGLEVINVGSLFEKYYCPNLIENIYQGNKLVVDNTTIDQLIKDVPEVEIKLLDEDTFLESDTSGLLIANNSAVYINIHAKDEKAAIDEIRIYNNDKLVQQKKYTSNKKRLGNKFEETFDLTISEGENNIKVIAFNKDRTESQPSQVKIYYNGQKSNVDLYVLAIGINKYQNPSYVLNYAADDAKACMSVIEKNAKNIFDSQIDYFLKDTEADKKGIQEAFDLIAKKAGPEDVFVFYFAGHGTMSSGNSSAQSDFYLIPYDVTQLYGDDQMLKEKAISANELLKFSMKVAARKQLFVLDACQSGGALNAFNNRGVTREKAIAQLARSTGTVFLLASGAIQYATEASDLKHGIFTYALLEGLNGRADGGIQDKNITANELKSYIEDRVPQLSEEYMLTPQYPTGYSFGQDFPVVIVK